MALEITFRGLSSVAQWVDVHINGFDGCPVATVRVHLGDDGGAAVPAFRPSSPPPMEQSAEAHFD